MSYFARVAAARQHRRSSATFDSPLRRTIRRFERTIKFLFMSPLALLVRPRRATVPLDITNVKSVLILRYDALGDAVLSSAVWHAVHRYNPNARIGVVASQRNYALIKADPVVSDVFLFSKALSWHIVPELFRARRAAKWDVVLNISFFDKTRAALYAKLVAPHAITVTNVHKNHERYQRIYSFVGNRESNIPAVLQSISVFQQTFGFTLTEEETYPTIFADTEVEKQFKQEIAARLGKANRYIIINLDAAQAFREWGLDNTAEFSRMIATEYPEFKIFWITGLGHSDRVTAFLKQYNLANVEYLLTPSVHHLLVAVKNATAVVSPDTSVVHIAAAFKRPTAGLYVENKEYPIRGTINRMVFAPDERTAKSIPVTSVLEALSEVLRETS